MPHAAVIAALRGTLRIEQIDARQASPRRLWTMRAGKPFRLWAHGLPREAF